jgi:hypothetical protein
MWDLILSLCHQKQFFLTPLSIHIDFEQVMHNGLMSVFPACKTDCCRFHLAQRWWREIQTVGLSSEYKDKSCKIGKWLSPFFRLPFLPAEEIEDCFVEDIMSEEPSDEKYTAFADYVLVCLIFRIIHLCFRLRKEPTMVQNLSILTKNHANEKIYRRKRQLPLHSTLKVVSRCFSTDLHNVLFF